MQWRVKSTLVECRAAREAAIQRIGKLTKMMAQVATVVESEALFLLRNTILSRALSRALSLSISRPLSLHFTNMLAQSCE
jgi:hypothetical protein